MPRFDYDTTDDLQEVLRGGGLLPPVLYHYTGGTGLLGILKDRQLWVTHTEFTNDREETRRGRSIVNEEVARMVDDIRDQSRTGRAMALRRVYRKQLSHDFSYVTCLSDNDDSLDLWRGYATGNFAGFALGLNAPNVDAAAREQGAGGLWRVDYDEEDFRARVRRVIQIAIEDPDQGFPTRELLSLGACLKSKGWEGEDEWRVVWTPRAISEIPDPDITTVDFRIGVFGLVPYIKLDLKFNNENDGHPNFFEGICVGSGAYLDERKRAVRMLHFQHGIAGVNPGDDPWVSKLNMR